MKIKDHYMKTKNPSAYVDANILHPAKKLHLFKKRDSSFAEVPDQAKIYEKGARARFNTIYNNSVQSESTVESVNTLKRKRGIDSDEDSNDSSDSDGLLNEYNELDYFLRLKRDKSVKDPLIWWRHNCGMFPKMGKWYRDVGAVPASSAGVEREFSMAGDIVTKKRNRLSGKTISKIMQYKHWRARRGEHIMEEPQDIPEEYDEQDSDVESEFDERNIELEEWLGQWIEKKGVGEAACDLFSNAA
jgi:hAT family C-terminal dimerisation region